MFLNPLSPSSRCKFYSLNGAAPKLLGGVSGGRPSAGRGGQATVLTLRAHAALAHRHGHGCRPPNGRGVSLPPAHLTRAQGRQKAHPPLPEQPLMAESAGPGISEVLLPNPLKSPTREGWWWQGCDPPKRPCRNTRGNQGGTMG